MSLLAWWVACLPDTSAEALRATLASPMTAWLIAMVLTCTYWHASLGLGTVIEDYISRPVLRRWLIYLTNSLLTLAWVAVLAALLAMRS